MLAIHTLISRAAVDKRSFVTLENTPPPGDPLDPLQGEILFSDFTAQKPVISPVEPSATYLRCDSSPFR